MNQNTEIALVLTTLLLIIVGVVFGVLRAWKKWRPANEETRRFLKRIFLAYVGLHFVTAVVESILGHSMIFEHSLGVILSPVHFAEATLELIFAAWVIWKVRPGMTPVSRTADTDAQRRRLVAEVFNSEDFLSALRTSLPKGEDDTKNGFDYIPFMLQSIDERRRTFQRSAGLFFRATITIGILFAGIVAIFGYLLLNEESTGTPRRVKELYTLTNQLNNEVTWLNPENATKDIDSIRSIAIGQLQKLTLNSPLAESRESFIAALKTLSDAPAMLALVTRAIEANSTSENATSPDYGEILQSLKDRLNQHGQQFGTIAAEVPTTVHDLQEGIRQVRESLGKDESQRAELIRRIAIGLIVATFFFAILRYVAGLYRKDYEEVRRAYADDLSLRRFYVAYKSSADKDRKLAIAALVAQKAETSHEDRNEFDITKEEGNLLKELLNTLGKKLT